VICAGVVFVEQGARLIPVQYAKRQVGGRQFSGQATNLPVKINSSGVIPPIFASSLLQLPGAVVTFMPDSYFGRIVGSILLPGQWLYNSLYLILIVFFAFFYTSITFKPDDIAENLKKNGGFIPGIRPGPKTSEYLQKIIMRLTIAGAIYLSAVCILPTILTDRFGVPFYFGGTSLLIVVGVALDTFRQIEAHRQSLRYDAFLKQSRSAGKVGRIRRR
jgi:preprotein translocase subunit SecY